nr:immunoglobulin light chain junction region [Macaca mulatta]MOW36704.1 immunoglobulin light chain junction region [Macaca mulatta]MOW36872.1 immunoglobulin light chain junction region [Macaca mulatta]MOW36921.1 immunoglobulin light chain junction region [Macaca mulatta]MOW37518.1 immunoglobulin light chain junction region [Macaca mulatta]
DYYCQVWDTSPVQCVF